MTPEENKFLIEWLEQIPTMDSHYCRNIPSYKDKKIFYPGTTQAQLHHEYQKAAETAYVRSASIFYFSQIILENNYSIFSPRKDLCDVCISFQNDNLSKEAYDYHILLKNETRNEKNEDKVSATEKKSIWSMDLQAVLLCPKSNASSLYYKTKLQVHNFTLFNLGTKDGYCYMCNESLGDLSSDVFAFLQFNHFDEVLTKNPKLEELIIWSDGCGYQKPKLKSLECLQTVSN